jgi:hypothetical protein
MNHQPMGAETAKAKITNFEKSFESKITKLATEAPITLRMPISFVRCSAIKAANPNKPRQVITIANDANMPANRLIKLMSENFFSKSESAKRYHKDKLDYVS